MLLTILTVYGIICLMIGVPISANLLFSGDYKIRNIKTRKLLTEKEKFVMFLVLAFFWPVVLLRSEY